MNNDIMNFLQDLAAIRLDMEGKDGPDGPDDDDFFMENDDAHSKLTGAVNDARSILADLIARCGTCSMPLAERHATWCPGSVT